MVAEDDGAALESRPVALKGVTIRPRRGNVR